MFIRSFLLQIISLAFLFAYSNHVDAQYLALVDQTSNPYFKIIETVADETLKLRKNEVELKIEIPNTTSPKNIASLKIKAPELNTNQPTRLLTTKSPNPKNKPYIRKTKRIAADYESYAVVLKNSDRPLLSTDPIFKQFGNVLYDKTEEGKYVYMICTPFKSKKSVEDFLEIVLQPRFSDAYIVAYDKGEMKK